MNFEEKNLNDFKLMESEILKNFEQANDSKAHWEIVKKRGTDNIKYSITPSLELYNRERKHNEVMWDNLKQPFKLYIGHEGFNALDRLVKRLLTNPKNPLELTISYKTLRQSIIDHFILATTSHGKEMDFKTASWIVRVSVKNIKNEVVKCEYFYPCVLSFQKNDDEFQIGPVKFMTKGKFDEEYHDKITGRDKATLSNELIKYYESAPWIAQVTVSNLEDNKGEVLSRQALEYALYVLKLAIKPSSGKFIRAIETVQSDKRCSFKVKDGEPLITYTISADAVLLGDEDFSKVFFEGYQSIFLNAGQLITHFLLGEKMPLVYQKLLNAIWWYGEAVDELLPSTKLIKYVNAVEAIVNTNEHQKATEHFRDRAIKLLSCYEGDVEITLNELPSRLNAIYNKRSELVHGTSGPLDDTISDDIHLMFNVANLVIIAGFNWTLYLADKQVDISLKSVGREFDNFDVFFDELQTRRKS